jgi:hypothetical protein
MQAHTRREPRAVRQLGCVAFVHQPRPLERRQGMPPPTQTDPHHRPGKPGQVGDQPGAAFYGGWRIRADRSTDRKDEVANCYSFPAK